MSKSTVNQDEIGPWSEVKLNLVAEYLQAYSTIMNSQKIKGWLAGYHYVDAFAGAVIAKAKGSNADEEETERYIEGSPLRALQIDPPFDAYWFIDRSRSRSRKLTELQLSCPDKDIRVHRGDCNEILRAQVIPHINYSSRQKGVVFLDPYGLQVEWATVAALAKAGTFDIFVNFPVMGITRLLKRVERPDEAALQEIERIMGDTEWVNGLYRPVIQPDIWGTKVMERDVIQAAWLAEQYAKRVGSLFKYVSESIVMYNRRNAPLYSLFLASHKEVAVKIVNDITKKYERDRIGTAVPAKSRKATKKGEDNHDFGQSSFSFD